MLHLTSRVYLRLANRPSARLGRVGGDDGITWSNKYLIFLYFIFAPSPSSSVLWLLALAFNAGCRCQHNCHCCCCCCCHHRHCNQPCCCHCAGVCVVRPSRPFVVPAGFCLLLCFCCWHLCHMFLFWLIVVFPAHCRGGAADKWHGRRRQCLSPKWLCRRQCHVTRGGEAKENAAYCHGSTAKDNTEYCRGGAGDNKSG